MTSRLCPPAPRRPLQEKQLGIRVSLALNERLAQLAAREQNGIAAVTRRLLLAALDREESMSR